MNFESQLLDKILTESKKYITKYNLPRDPPSLARSTKEVGRNCNIKY